MNNDTESFVNRTISNPLLRPLRKSFKKEEVIIQEGEKFKALYILVSGKVGVFIDGNCIAEIDEPGEYFGEIAVLLKQKYNATVIALETSSLIEVPQDKLEAFVSHSPKIALSMAKKLAKRLLKIDKQYVEALANDEDERL